MMQNVSCQLAYYRQQNSRIYLKKMICNLFLSVRISACKLLGLVCGRIDVLLHCRRDEIL